MFKEFLCLLTNKINSLVEALNNTQNYVGLDSDSTTTNTISGRLKAIEEKRSSVKIDVNRPVINGMIETTYQPIDDCFNKQILLQHPTDPEIWEPTGYTTIVGNVITLGSSEYDGWKATLTYVYSSSESGYLVDSNSNNVITYGSGTELPDPYSVTLGSIFTQYDSNGNYFKRYQAMLLTLGGTDVIWREI